MSVGLYPVLVVHDGRLIRDLVKQDDAVAKNIGYDVSAPLIGNGILRTSGAVWKRHRAVMDKAFSTAVVQRAAPLANALSRSYVERLTTAADLGAIVERGDRCLHVELWPLLSMFSADFIGLLGFSRRFDGALGPAFRTVLDVLFLRLQAALVLPLLNWLPTHNNRRFWRGIALLRSTVAQLVRQGRRHIIDGRQQEEEWDILQGVLQHSEHMSEQQVCDEALTVLFAGSDTTSSTLAFALLLLAEHPDQQRRVHDEVDALAAALCGGDVGPAHFDALPYLGLVVKETLRLYPPAIIGRTARHRQARLPSLDLTLPDGIDVFLNIYAAHRLQRVWGPDADAFRPERMAQLTDEQKHFYLPFGAAPRLCIGQKIAEIEMRILLFHILHHFTVTLRSGYPHYQLYPDITLHPNHTWVTFYHR